MSLPKLLIVTRSTPLHPGAGGMEEISWQLAEQLSATWDVHVLTTPIAGHDSPTVRDGVTVHTVKRGRPGRYGLAWWSQTAHHPAARDANVVLSVSAGATAMTWRRRPAFVFQAHGNALSEALATLRSRPRLWPLKAARSLWWAGVDSITYRRMDVVAAASDHVRDGLLRRFYRGTWERTRLEVIPNGVHAPAAPAERDQPSTGDKIVAVTVSRLSRQKGVDRVIAALSDAPDHVMLLVVGDGEEELSLREQAARLGVADRVHFAGRLDRADVADALAAADVFVFPARNTEREGLPISILEALASGLPVLVPAESTWPDDLAEVMESIEMDDTTALAAALAAKIGPRTHVSTLPRPYSGDGMADAYRDLFDSLLGR